MVKDAAGRADKDVNAFAQLVRLVLDGAAFAAVDGEDGELGVVVLQPFESGGDLNGELARGRQDNRLRLARLEKLVGSEIFDHGQAEGKRLARTRQIPDYQIFPIINISKSHVLNGEET